MNRKTPTAYTRFSDEERFSFMAAFEAGEAAAKALKPGDTFTGAFGAAEAAGYIAPHYNRSAFVTGYLKSLARPVVTDFDNVILRMGN